jgi:hypothetical protein
MLLTALGAFIFNLRYAYNDKLMRFIPYYVMASFIQDSIGFYNEYINKNKGSTDEIVQNISGNIFLLVEFLLLTNFLLKSIVSKTKRNVTRAISVLFLCYLCTFWLARINPVPNFYKGSAGFYSLESLILVIPCLFYFYELFKLLHPVNLNDHPSFWVVTGILFYHSCSIPLFLIIPVIRHNFSLYYEIAFSLNYILYGIFFLLLIRASYMARPPALALK